MYRWRGNFVNAKEGPFLHDYAAANSYFRFHSNSQQMLLLQTLSLFEISEYRHGYHVIPSSCSLENYRPQYPDFDEKITSELKYIFKANIGCLFLNSRNELHLLLSWNTFCIYSCQIIKSEETLLTPKRDPFLHNSAALINLRFHPNSNKCCFSTLSLGNTYLNSWRDIM